MKVLYVRNLTATVTEEKLQEVFEEHGKVDRVKKIKDYAFVHFQDRDKAVVAMNALNHTDLLGANLEISLAKPPSDKKKKEEMLRKREARMMRAINSKYDMHILLFVYFTYLSISRIFHFLIIEFLYFLENIHFFFFLNFGINHNPWILFCDFFFSQEFCLQRTS